MLISAKLINYAYGHYGFVSFFIYGKQGTGKTTYCLKVLKEAYGDWDIVLKNTYFYIDTLIPRLKQCVKEGKRIKAILLDDAGVWLIKYQWFKRFPIWFGKLWNLMRTVCSGILFTSVEVCDIIKFVRDKIEYRISIVPLSDVERMAKAYKVRVLPSMDKIIEKAYYDYFTLRLPGDVRKEYEEMRREALERLMKELEGKGREKDELVDVDLGDVRELIE